MIFSAKISESAEICKCLYGEMRRLTAFVIFFCYIDSFGNEKRQFAPAVMVKIAIRLLLIWNVCAELPEPFSYDTTFCGFPSAKARTLSMVRLISRSRASRVAQAMRGVT